MDSIKITQYGQIIFPADLTAPKTLDLPLIDVEEIDDITDEDYYALDDSAA